MYINACGAHASYLPEEQNETGRVRGQRGIGVEVGGGLRGGAAAGAAEGLLMASTQFQGTQWSVEPIFPKRQFVILSCAPTIR